MPLVSYDRQNTVIFSYIKTFYRNLTPGFEFNLGLPHHHTSGSSVDCAIQSRLQRVVLEKKPRGQSLGSFVGDIVSTSANYNEFLCTVVAPMIVARKTRGMM